MMKDDRKISNPSVSAGYVPQVDGLRAFAALAVVFFHEGNFPYGWAGVWVFFVISGFVITRMMINSGWTLNIRNYKIFSYRRIARIWPLYFLYVSLCIIFSAYDNNSILQGYGHIMGIVTFSYNFFISENPFNPTIDHLWTISVEQQFYIFYPLIFSLLLRFNKVLVLGGVLVASFALRVGLALGMPAYGVPSPETARIVYFFSAAHFDAFMAGALVAFYPSQIVRLRAHLGAIALAALACAFAFVLYQIDYAALPARSWWAIIQATKPAFGTQPAAYGAAIWCYALWVLIAVAVLAQALAPAGIIKRLLGWSVLVWIGQVSFGVYVWQGLVAPIFFNAMGISLANASGAVRLMTMGLYVAVLVAVASASMLLFERRFHRRAARGKRLAVNA